MSHEETIRELELQLKKAQEVANKLNEKLSHQMNYYESQLVSSNEELNSVISKYNSLKQIVSSKEEKLSEAEALKEQLLCENEDLRDELYLKKEECKVLRSRILQAVESEPNENTEDRFEWNKDYESDESDESDREGELQFVKDEDDEFETDNDFSSKSEHSNLNSEIAANEQSMTIKELMKLIEILKFENASIKKEKVQLYNYINKLLKNKPADGDEKQQNDLLKSKLVNRRTLRVVSGGDNFSSSANKLSVPKKRIVSNYVDSKYEMSKKDAKFKFNALKTAHAAHQEQSTAKAVNSGNKKWVKVCGHQIFGWRDGITIGMIEGYEVDID